MGIMDSIAGKARVGREDRLARAGIALSLLLMAAFAWLASGGAGVITGLFGILGGYFVITALLARDPIYTAFEVDTRSDAELSPAARLTALAADPEVWVDLRDRQPEPGAQDAAPSPLGS